MDHGLTVVTTTDATAEPEDDFARARRAVLLPDTSAFALGRAFIPDFCANCLSPLLEETEALFCSEWCKEAAATIRYLRGTYRDGRMDDPDVKEAIDIRIAFMMSGSYGALGRTLTPTLRAEVKERDGGVCQSCGKPGAEIDHISGSSADATNLQLLCTECHRIKTMESMVPAPAEEKAVIAQLFMVRVFPNAPQLLADAELEWKNLWSGLKKERRQRLKDEIESLGVSLRGLTKRADWIAKREAEPSKTAMAVDDSSRQVEGSDFEWNFGDGTFLDEIEPTERY
jgi:hypothetical protein